MKNIKKILFVLVIVLGLTGCSFAKKDEKNEKPEKPVKKYELNTSLFNWIGSYENEEDNTRIDIYVFANGNNLDVDITIPGNDDVTIDDEGVIHYTSEGGYSFSFNVETIEDDVITVSDEYLGLKGTIEKADSGFNVDLVYGDAHEAHAIKGYFKALETVGGIKGYYSNEHGVIAISPLADYVRVSINVNGSSDEICNYITDSEISCEDDFSDDYIKVTKTDNGIKVDSNKTKIKGEYKEEK